MINAKLLIKGLGYSYTEPLSSVIPTSFYIQLQKNSSWELQFNAYDDGSIAFEMLTVESSVFWDGQEYIIKQLEPDYSGGITTFQVTAVHVAYELYRVYQWNTATGSYTPQQILSYYLDGNSLGFTYEVVGNFNPVVFQSIGAGNAKDMLSTIVDAWPDAIFYPDNKNIRIYQHDSIAKNLGNRIDYLHNTNEVTLAYDSSNGFVNRVRVVSPEVSNSSSDNPSYYFNPFYVTDDDSIAKYGLHDGGDVTDDSLTDTAKATTYAKKQLTNPTLSIDTKQNGNEMINPFEIRRLEIRPAGFVTNVEMVDAQYYPLSPTTDTSITFDNSVQTILDYNRNQKRLLSRAITTSRNIAKQVTSVALTADKAYSARVYGEKVGDSDY